MLRKAKVIAFRESVLRWGKENIKQYPWRWLDSAYKVLVAEFMLHRTQVKQVIPIYENFIAKYPDLEVFSNVDTKEVKNNLYSLGLQWRVDAMVIALTELWHRYKQVPIEPSQLMEIPGIGQYIAAATYCFTQNKPIALIDTNTVRVIGRVFGIDTSGEARRRKDMITAIQTTCDPIMPREYYYAVIDLAHNICKPVNPKCLECPLLNVPCKFGQQFIKNR